MESTVLRQARHRRHPSLSEVESESISDTGQNCWGSSHGPKPPDGLEKWWGWLCGAVATTVTASSIPVSLTQTEVVLASHLFSIPEVSPAQDSPGLTQHPMAQGRVRAQQAHGPGGQAPLPPALLCLLG